MMHLLIASGVHEGTIQLQLQDHKRTAFLAIQEAARALLLGILCLQVAMYVYQGTGERHQV